MPSAWNGQMPEVPFLDLGVSSGMPEQFGAPAVGGRRWEEVFPDDHHVPLDAGHLALEPQVASAWVPWDVPPPSPSVHALGSPVASWAHRHHAQPFLDSCSADIVRDAADSTASHQHGDLAGTPPPPGEADEAGEWESSSDTIWGEKVDDYLSSIEHLKRLGLRGPNTPARAAAGRLARAALPAAPAPAPAGARRWRDVQHPAQLSLEWVDRSRVRLGGRGTRGGADAGSDALEAEEEGEEEDDDEEEGERDDDGAEGLRAAPDASAVREGFKMLTSGDLGAGAWVMVPGKGDAARGGASALDLAAEIRWWVTCVGRRLRLGARADGPRAEGAARRCGSPALGRARRRGETDALLASDAREGPGEGRVVRARRGAALPKSSSLDDGAPGRAREREGPGARRSRSRRVSAGRAGCVSERQLGRRGIHRRGARGRGAAEEGEGDGEGEMVVAGLKVGALDEVQRMRLLALFREMRRTVVERSAAGGVGARGAGLLGNATAVDRGLWGVIMYDAMMLAQAQAAAAGFADAVDGDAILRRMQGAGVAPSLLTYNRMLELVEGAARHGRAGLAESEAVMRAMSAGGIAPDRGTFLRLLGITANAAAAAADGAAGAAARGADAHVAHARWLLSCMRAAGVPICLGAGKLALRAVVGAARAGRASYCEADALLDELAAAGVACDLAAFSLAMRALMAAGAPGVGAIAAGERLLERMEAAGVRPPVRFYRALVEVLDSAQRTDAAGVNDMARLLQTMARLCIAPPPPAVIARAMRLVSSEARKGRAQLREGMRVLAQLRSVQAGAPQAAPAPGTGPGSSAPPLLCAGTGAGGVGWQLSPHRPHAAAAVRVGGGRFPLR